MAKKKEPLSRESFVKVDDDQVSALLKSYADEVKALPEFRPPTTRDEAVDLLVRAGIEPDSPIPRPEPKAKRAKFRVKHPTIVNGHFWGLVIRDGVGETDDASVVTACLERGCVELDD